MINFICDVHPLWDLEQREWVAQLDGREFTAPRLEELRRQLPPEIGIRDYYPKGYRGARMNVDVKPISESPAWSLRYSASHIGERQQQRIRAVRALAHKAPEASTPHHQYPQYRKPPHRQPAPSRPWTADDDRELLELIEQGYTSGQIGEQLRRSRCSIIGRCHRKNYKLGVTKRPLEHWHRAKAA